MTPERLSFTVAEAAEILGWSRDGVYDAIEQGHLARIPHTGRRVLVARVELERFAALGLQDASTPAGTGAEGNTSAAVSSGAARAR